MTPPAERQTGLRRRIYPLTGMALALLTVAGMLALRALSERARPTLGWLRAEVAVNREVYGYLLCSTALLAASLGRWLGRREDRLVATALTDAGTRLSNRHRFDQRLATELRCARRCGRPIALMLLDVDRLKRLNDRAGHAAGDRALGRVADALRTSCRGADLAARWGGDEFVLLMPATTAAQALTVAERVRAQLAAGRAAVTVSIGLADLAGGERGDAQTLFLAADRALRRAKQGGRGRVCLAREPRREGAAPIVKLPARAGQGQGQG